MVIITPPQPFYEILLIANSTGNCLKLAKLSDIFLRQSASKETDLGGTQGLSCIQRGQLSYQLACTISALTVAILQVAVVNAFVFSQRPGTIVPVE